MADGKGVVDSGVHFMDGNHACGEGAIAAGCRFASGYPITPSTEVVEYLARRFPMIGGMFVQLEDEFAASICFQGAVWAGMKGMTVTSGPGFSLMMEHIGLAVMTELPCVIVNVQRAGPSTGLPTAPGQQDVMQARWGSHGDYEVIALSPSSPQECFDLIITAFNFAEKYRCPVFFMMDETVGHMLGKVEIPDESTIEVVPRKLTERAPGEYEPYKIYDGDVPEMVATGQGHRIHITGLTHNEKGYPEMTNACQDQLIRRLCTKITDHVEDLTILDEEQVADSDVVVVAYGITARIARFAARQAAAAGASVGSVKLITLWPFNDRYFRDLAKKTKHIVMVEMNLGQLVNEVERAVAGKVPVHFVGNAGGETIAPEVIMAKIEEVTR